MIEAGKVLAEARDRRDVEGEKRARKAVERYGRI